jgi:CheY-like chemotaxis protein
LGQLLAALAGNAVKFTPAGAVTLRVNREKAGAIPPGSSAPHSSPVPIHFSVEDTGIGIPDDRVRAIFEPFEQDDDSSSRRYGGLGLGLNVASRLAALMGGRIEVASEPGRGSCFSLSLPLEPAEAAPPEVRRHVLVVLAGDDERDEVVGFLATWGLPATAARTGRQALTELLRAVVEGAPFGLVVIEEHLPDLSAREVLHRLRDRSDTPPVVLLGLTESDVPLPDGVRAVLPHRAAGPQLRQAVLNSLSWS